MLPARPPLIKLRTLLLLHAALAAACPLTANALVIAGPNGLANSTQSPLNSWVTASGRPTFPYWDNVITVSDASGVYLGNSGSYGYVLTAAHVTSPPGSNSITVAGTTYTVRDNVPIGSTDLRLYRIGGETGDPALPALMNIPIASGSPSIGTALLDFGRGGRVETTSDSPVISDIANVPGTNATAFEWAGAGPMRWGTNNTASTSFFAGSTTPFILIPGLSSTASFISRFDDAGIGNYQTTTEAGLAGGDSGGPAFTVNGSLWEISGINSFVTGTAGLTDFGNYSGYNDLATYRSSIIAAMVPEPSVSGVLALGLVLLMKRRSRPCCPGY